MKDVLGISLTAKFGYDAAPSWYLLHLVILHPLLGVFLNLVGIFRSSYAIFHYLLRKAPIMNKILIGRISNYVYFFKNYIFIA